MELVVNRICTTQLNYATSTLIVATKRISSQSKAKTIKPRFFRRNPIIANTWNTIVTTALVFSLNGWLLLVLPALNTFNTQECITTRIFAVATQQLTGQECMVCVRQTFLPVALFPASLAHTEFTIGLISTAAPDCASQWSPVIGQLVLDKLYIGLFRLCSWQHVFKYLTKSCATCSPIQTCLIYRTCWCVSRTTHITYLYTYIFFEQCHCDLFPGIWVWNFSSD